MIIISVGLVRRKLKPDTGTVIAKSVNRGMRDALFYK